MTCECGSIYIIGNKSRHLKTKKHLNYLESIKKGLKEIVI